MQTAAHWQGEPEVRVHNERGKTRNYESGEGHRSDGDVHPEALCPVQGGRAQSRASAGTDQQNLPLP